MCYHWYCKKTGFGLNFLEHVLSLFNPRERINIDMKKYFVNYTQYLQHQHIFLFGAKMFHGLVLYCIIMPLNSKCYCCLGCSTATFGQNHQNNINGLTWAFIERQHLLKSSAVGNRSDTCHMNINNHRYFFIFKTFEVARNAHIIISISVNQYIVYSINFN